MSKRSLLFKVLRTSVVVLVCAVAVFATMTELGMLRWSPVCCWCDEVDIQSGRTRRTYFVAYCCVSAREQDSLLSRVATPTNREPEWHRVNTFSPLTDFSCPHNFNDAFVQIEMVSALAERNTLPPDEHTEVADKVLEMWRANKSDHGAMTYLHHEFAKLPPWRPRF